MEICGLFVLVLLILFLGKVIHCMQNSSDRVNIFGDEIEFSQSILSNHSEDSEQHANYSSYLLESYDVFNEDV